MAEMKLTGLLQLTFTAYDALWRRGDGSAALLYLFFLRHGRLPQSDEAAQAGLIPSALEASRRLLEDEGLISVKALTAQAADTPPGYTMQDISEGLKLDNAFAWARLETERLLGRVLSSSDLRTLYMIYDWRGFSADVLVMLVQAVTDEYRDRYGEGSKPPTLRQIAREAERWEEQGIRTHEAAERQIRRRAEQRSQAGRILRVLGIEGRALSDTENKYLRGWIEMGFPPESVAMAYDRTTAATGQLKWPYLNKILSNWHEMKLHSPEEIAAGDSKPGAQASAGAAKPMPGTVRRVEKSVRPIAPPGQAEWDAVARLLRQEGSAEAE